MKEVLRRVRLALKILFGPRQTAYYKDANGWRTWAK